MVTTAAFAWVNHVLIGLSQSIGLLVMGLAASFAMIGLELALPQASIYERLAQLMLQIDFRRAVLDGLLAFLLFAGALHVDLSALKSRAWPVSLMATAGVLISTGVVGVGLWWVSTLLGTPISLHWALVFGALISPTDPVAVLSTLRSVRVPQALEIDMAGESLFNDGVGVVVFTVLLAVASGESEPTLVEVGEFFLLEAVGGGLLGLLLGYLAYKATRAIDEYAIETLISLALVTGTYALATSLHMSGPIAVVVAGILIGNRGPKDAMSDQTQKYVFGFWTLVDQILNAVLFLLIGLEVLVVRFDAAFLGLAAASVVLALLGRLCAVLGPFVMLQRFCAFTPGTVPVLVWGGLRGGISIALALSLPEVPARTGLLMATYAVVVFTILAQGLTLGAVVRRTVKL